MTVTAPMDARPIKPRTRLDQLDALRGIAALVVVVHHTLLATAADGAQILSWSVCNIVVLGRPAVILFFVLSAFVLTLHLEAAQESFLSFAIRRVVRLLPSYAVGIGCAAMLFTVTRPHGPTGLSRWFDAQWSGDFTVVDVWRHLALIAGPRQFPLDHVAWSLVHEVRLSLALPLLLVLVRRCGPAPMLLGVGIATLVAEGALVRWPATFPAGVHGFRFDVEGLGLSLVLTVRFGLSFALGALLATHSEPFKAAMRRPGVGLLGLVIALSLLSCRSELLMAPGAALLVAAVAWSPLLVAAFRIWPLLWIGRLSFSLYLVHLPIMLACVYAGQGYASASARLIIGLGLALPSAAAMTYGIEDTAIEWSRSAARFVAGWSRLRFGAGRLAADPR